MIRWTGLAPWEFEFPFPGSLTSSFLGEDAVRAVEGGNVRAQERGLSSSLLLSSLELSHTQSPCALNTSPPRNQVKQRLRDVIAPDKGLGHSDTPVISLSLSLSLSDTHTLSLSRLPCSRRVRLEPVRRVGEGALVTATLTLRSASRSQKNAQPIGSP